MMTDKDQAGDPEPPGGTDPGLAQPADEDTSAYSHDSEFATASSSTGDPEPPGNTGDPEPPGGDEGIRGW
jgi:hypothetical protein